MKKTIAVLSVGAVLTLAGCSAPEAEFTLFADVASRCSADGVTVSDGGTTLTVDMMGETDWSGASVYDVECVISAVEMPTFVKDNIWNTNALAGRQSASFDLTLGGEGTDYAETDFVVDVQWSYHPDNGLDAVFHAEPISDK
jgi:hypothetical protein